MSDAPDSGEDGSGQRSQPLEVAAPDIEGSGPKLKAAPCNPRLAKAFADWEQQHGKLQPADLGRAMRQQGYAPTEAELRAFAEQKHGDITADDFCAYCEATGFEDPSLEELAAFFKPFDQEKTGFVHTGVFYQIMLSMGETFEEKEVKNMLEDLRAGREDLRRDIINYREFVAWALER
eukprot:TRINITY_DN15093_c0_g1_i1.p2 TRINITY_DN15093_c0_g1~~TRINITY_DN15093_c0_g1_i1.p2  ORF type:complete len:195 (+),score=62.33 TRINITY_DN15093_c0_g1_i1:54-587(+)